MMNFSALKLTRPLLKAVEEQGYERPSPIQQQAIPPILQGYDLLGCAQTGTGKTAAFALPILQRMGASHPRHKGVRALILTPTRELALQIDACFSNYGKYINVKHAVVFGGVGQQPQVEALQRGVDVLTACPGRLNDLIAQGHVNLQHLEIFVLDEADRMLDMGFVNDVKRVIRHLPAQRQNLLFSATMPKEIEELANQILKKPVCVKVDPVSSTTERIQQMVYPVEKPEKKAFLSRLVQACSLNRILVFSRTKHGADAIAKFLNKQQITAAAIHGDKGQTARVKALEQFKNGDVRVLVATDIAARGIDISELPCVINFDLPEVPETYVHRIGRTARAGAHGVAISFCSSEERKYLDAIETLIRKKIPKKPLEDITVEEKNNQSGQALSASAKRRRRRRRGAGKNTEAAAAVREEKQEKSQQAKPNHRAQAKQPVVRQENKPQAGAGRNSKNQQKKTRQERPESVRTERAHRQERAKSAAQNEDPGLLLISRKPPAQKFANFEEYMKSRGGFSEPVQADDEE